LHKGELCEKCYYWERSSHKGEMYGTCHRFPQEVDKNATDWCGEFKKDE